MDAIRPIITQLWETISRIVLSSFPFLVSLFILGAGCLGMLIHKRLKRDIRELISKCLGVAVILYAISELWNSFFILQEGRMEAEGTLLAVISLPLGWLFGEALRLDHLLGSFGITLCRLFNRNSSSASKEPSQQELSVEENALQTLQREEQARGFMISATLCGFTSLSYTHFLDGRINQDPIPLLILLAFDILLILGLATVYGLGASLSSLLVLLHFGGLGLAYSLFGDFFTTKLLGQLSIVGGVILLVGGVCLCRGKRFHAANLIPALLVPILYVAVVTKTENLIKGLLEKDAS